MQEEMARVGKTARITEDDGSLLVPADSIQEVESSAQPASPEEEIQLEEEEEEDLLLLEESDEGQEEEGSAPSTYVGKKTPSLPTPQSVPVRDDFVDNIDREKLEKEIIRGQGPRGEEFSVVIPSKGNAVTDAPEDCFAVYTQVLDFGVRFPLPDFINNLLKRYNIGICNLTPNSWHHIITYASACSIHNLTPSSKAFIHLHKMVRASKSKGWFALSNLDKYLTLIGKANKVTTWRGDFVFIRCSNQKFVDRMKMWTSVPNFLGKVTLFPPLLDQDLATIELFRSKGATFRGEHLRLPLKWLPFKEYFFDTKFLEATGLIPNADKGDDPSILVNLC